MLDEKVSRSTTGERLKPAEFEAVTKYRPIFLNAKFRLQHFFDFQGYWIYLVSNTSRGTVLNRHASTWQMNNCSSSSTRWVLYCVLKFVMQQYTNTYADLPRNTTFVVLFLKKKLTINNTGPISITMQYQPHVSVPIPPGWGGGGGGFHLGPGSLSFDLGPTPLTLDLPPHI